MKRLQALIAIVSAATVAGTGIVPAGVLSEVAHAAESTIITVDSFEELQSATPADLDTASLYVVDYSSGQAEGSNNETYSLEEAFGIEGAESEESISAQIEETDTYAVSEPDSDTAIVFSPYARHRLIVFTDSDMTETFGATDVSFFTQDGGYRLCYESEQDTKAAYDALSEQYGEDAVLIDLPVQLSAAENADQAVNGWGTEYMHLDAAGKRAENAWSGEDVTVAILDTGINTGHEVFADKTIVKTGDASVEDENGHGTAVAGIIAESTPDFVELMPVKIANANGECSFDDMLNGLTEATEAGADVVNLSMNVTLSDYVESGVLTQTQADAYISRADDVCQSVEEKGTTICVSAGNEGKDIKDTCDFPASLEHVLSVGAIDVNEARADFSSYGEELDFTAPGKGIQCAWIGTETSVKALSGTSMASPYLAAACAIVKSEDPEADRDDVERKLASVAKDLGETGKDAYYGYGVPVFAADVEGTSTDEEDAELIDGINFPEDWDAEDPQNSKAYAQLYGDTQDETEEPVLTTSSITATTRWKLYGEDTYKEFQHDSRNTAGSGIIPVIDVSYHNDSVDSSADDINWSKVKAAGVKGVMIRCGYRGSASSGTLNKDKQFDNFIKGAKAAGLKVGVYFFSQATTVAEANAEADYAINIVKNSGYALDLPLATDIEFASSSSGRLYDAHLSKNAQTNIAKAFCNKVKSSGYKPLVYASSSFLVSHLDGNALYAGGYPIWMARYRYAAYSDSSNFFDKPVSLWQCTSDAAVNGISTRVDLNYWYNYYGWIKVVDGNTVKWRWKDVDGNIVKNKWISYLTDWYYIKSDTYMAANEWAKDSTGWCWLDSNGVMVRSKWIKYAKDGEWYYLGEDGHMLTNGWAQDSTGWCWMDADGKILKQTGWKDLGGNRYYLNNDYYRLENQWMLDDGGMRYLGAEGMVATDFWAKYEGEWYYLDATGYRATNIWAKDSVGWCLLGEDGKIVKTTGWILLEGEWYYLKSNHYRAANEWVEKDGIKHWIGDNGKIAKNAWINANGDWYCLDKDGIVLTNCWKADSNGLCWLGADGKIVKSKWILYNGQWYYLNASGYRAANEWAKDSSGWCYLDANGLITKSAWVKYNGYWYYLKPSGYMAANEWAKDSVGWCWMDANGKVTRNKWIKYNGYWYYLKPNGYMAANEWTTDSKYRYWMGKDGRIAKTYSK